CVLLRQKTWICIPLQSVLPPRVEAIIFDGGPVPALRSHFTMLVKVSVLTNYLHRFLFPPVSNDVRCQPSLSCHPPDPYPVPPSSLSASFCEFCGQKFVPPFVYSASFVVNLPTRLHF